ncbi:transposase family protein [Laspinema olomoucense]|uniref:Transposase family protein n=1 Tax=Laspinema olomoucense D3b TaxID=2953688 RepID=A0ABT2N329_9CYAN|nr:MULTISPECIES: transposase family protein [unclassified Laspinema]MCT7974579.1 transposase family protein [Laspinema sp. D3d]MCT7977094.1 transposase family protein [Laspinema sp. D3b]MCT7987508.1 transposase family protein [Laspinema sp. D3a]
MSQGAIVEAFAALDDCRRPAGMRHQQSLCLALFTRAVAAGNRGFIAIGDCLKAYPDELWELFKPEKKPLPSYSTLRRTLLRIAQQRYSACLSVFFELTQ